MKSHIYIIIAAMLILLSCSNIGEDERLIAVETPAPVPADSDSAQVPVEMRRVLLEDFTGQRCVNCPNAADEIERLQQAYGSDTIVAVGIHSSNLAVYGNDRVVGLRTATGDSYYDYWKVEGEPMGLINRRGRPTTLDQWFTLVNTALQEKAAVSIALQNDYDAATRTLDVTTTLTGIEAVDGMLQLWLTESGIVAIQLMPDGSANANYVHNHVFRTAVNGTWGEPVALTAGQQQTLRHSVTLDDTWVPDNVSVVAFVYNDGGVQQVKEKKIR